MQMPIDEIKKEITRGLDLTTVKVIRRGNRAYVFLDVRCVELKLDGALRTYTDAQLINTAVYMEARPKWIEREIERVDVRFDGPGTYWLAQDRIGGGEIPLDRIESESDLSQAVREVIEADSGEEDWGGWRTKRTSVADEQ
jgi:hypothetical protein